MFLFTKWRATMALYRMSKFSKEGTQKEPRSIPKRNHNQRLFTFLSVWQKRKKTNRMRGTENLLFSRTLDIQTQKFELNSSIRGRPWFMFTWIRPGPCRCCQTSTNYCPRGRKYRDQTVNLLPLLNVTISPTLPLRTPSSSQASSSLKSASS